MYPVKPGVFRVGDFFYSLVRQRRDMSSTWIAVIGVAFALFLLNAVFAYRYRSRQLRSQGQEPPPFFVYLFFPRPWTNRVSTPRPLRVSVGIVIFVGGAAFVLGGSILLANLQLTTLSHPVGAVLALLALISLGIA